MESVMFLGFGLDAWITIVTVLGMFTILLFTKWRSDVVFLGAIGVLFVTGVLDAKEAFSGFSGTSVITVGVLFVVVAGLTHTGVLQWIVKNLLGTPSSYSKAVTRLMLPVAALSSFLSNTTVVALFVGIVKMWAKRLGVSPSKLLIPLSYASGMGGVCTLIGTPPNLIISGLYEEKTGAAMNILTTTIPGLFCLCVGVLSIIAMCRLLPDRKAPENAFESTGEYTVEFQVPSDNPYIGQTLGEAGLFNVKGGSLIEIYHFDGVPSPVSEDELIMGGDHLVYSGQIDELIELSTSHKLVSASHHVFSIDEVDRNLKLHTAYVNFGSKLIGKTIGGSTFEKDNNLILVAVARRGERISEAPRQVVLRAGDRILCRARSFEDCGGVAVVARVVLLYLHTGKPVARHQSRHLRALVLADLEEDRASWLQQVYGVRQISVVEVEPRFAAVQRDSRLEVLHPRIKRSADGRLDVWRVRHDHVHALRFVEIVETVHDNELHGVRKNAFRGVLLGNAYRVARNVRPKVFRARELLRKRKYYRAGPSADVDDKTTFRGLPVAGAQE